MIDIAERMSSDATSPELSFFSYAFVSVFNIFKESTPGCLYKEDGRNVHFRNSATRAPVERVTWGFDTAIAAREADCSLILAPTDQEGEHGAEIHR
jgi:hypothetical protein